MLLYNFTDVFTVTKQTLSHTFQILQWGHLTRRLADPDELALRERATVQNVHLGTTERWFLIWFGLV